MNNVEITILNKDQIGQLALDWANGKNPGYNEILAKAGIELKEDFDPSIWEEFSAIQKLIKEEAIKLVNPTGIKFNHGLVARGSLVHVLFDHDGKSNGIYRVKYIVRNSEYSDIVVTETYDGILATDYSFHIDYVQKIVEMGKGGTRLHKEVWTDSLNHGLNETRHSNLMRQYSGLAFNTHQYTSYGHQDYVRQWLVRYLDRLGDVMIDGGALMEGFVQQNWVKQISVDDDIYHPNGVVTFPKKKAIKWLKANVLRYRWTRKQEEQARKDHEAAMEKMYKEDMEREYRRDFPEQVEEETDTQVSVFEGSCFED